MNFTTTDLAIGHVAEPSPERNYLGEYEHQLRTLTAADAMEYFGDSEFMDAVDVILARGGAPDARIIGSLFIAARDLYAHRLASHEVFHDFDSERTDRPNTPAQAVALVHSQAIAWDAWCAARAATTPAAPAPLTDAQIAERWEAFNTCNAFCDLHSFTQTVRDTERAHGIGAPIVAPATAASAINAELLALTDAELIERFAPKHDEQVFRKSWLAGDLLYSQSDVAATVRTAIASATTASAKP